MAAKLTAAPAPLVASIVRGVDTGGAGGVVSCTVTVKVPVGDALPESSTATHDTSVMASGNVEPDAGLQVTVGVAST